MARERESRSGKAAAPAKKADKADKGSAPKAPTPPQKPASPPPARRSSDTLNDAPPSGRASFVSVDLEDMEVIEDRPSETPIEEIDIEFEEAPGSVDKLLAITGEGWTVDAHRENLKDAAKDPDKADTTPPSARPDLAIPTPFDLGAAEGPSSVEMVAARPRSIPPPLPPGASAPPLPPGASMPPLPPGASMPPLPPPPPTGAVPQPRPSVPPPPTGRDDVNRLPPPPPSRNNKPSAPSLAPAPAAPAPVASAPPAAPAASRRPPPLPRENRAPLPQATATQEGAALVELLRTRAERLEANEDKVGLARVFVETSIVHESMCDDAKAVPCAEAALKVDPDLVSAHAIVRRRIHARSQLVPMLRHLEREIAGAASEATAVELVAERARLLDAGDQADDAREAWELALARAPHHAAALKGLEGDLVRRAFEDETSDDRWEDLVAHLGRMSDAYAGQPALAAWLHVERAHILEHRIGRVDAARGALERAVRMDATSSPVRSAYTLHCAAHQDSARLASMLAEEARLETSSARCARLELDAACIYQSVLEDDAQAISLLERAAARAPTTPSVDRRVLDDLLRLYERSAQWPEVARTRRSRLRFFTDPSALVYELRKLAGIEERLGNLDAAIADIERALGLDGTDATLLDELDRLLAAADKGEERIALWHAEATRSDDPTKRARALSRAAQLAEGFGRPAEALRHLRAAWVAAPGDSEILDHLSRLLSPTPTERFDGEARALVELYAQAAQSTRDHGRRVAYYEKIAMLWEELVGDQQRAARTYEEILKLEPGRRGAVLGLERTAGRTGDERALSHALYEEAKLADDGADVLALRVRSASVLARVDPARASAIVAEVLAQDAAHPAGRALETRLHEEAARWDAATQSIRARIEIALTTHEKVALWLSLAAIYGSRLMSPNEAVAALREARKLDPVHPVPPEEIARLLETLGDARELHAAVAGLADDAITPQERARHLTHAAEIAELRMNDDAAAADLYARALVETPEDELIGDRLTRVLARRAATSGGGPGPRTFDTPETAALLAHVATRIERATSHAQAQAASFDLAERLVVMNKDLPRAQRLLEEIVDRDPSHAAALRVLEQIALRALAVRSGPSSYTQLARTLALQGSGFADVRARLGAYWELAAIEEWRTSGADSLATYERILELDPTDPSALEATVRLQLGPARRGDSAARRASITALRALSALANDEGSRIAIELRLALLLEAHAGDMPDHATATAIAREALDRLRDVLEIDALSVAAATSLARVANRLGDTAGAAIAAMSLADLAVQPKVRAKYLVDAANLLLSEAADDSLGSMSDRNERAALLLEKALDADPNSLVAATRLSQVRTAQHSGERLIDAFRSALERASAKDAIVLLGSEIARVARDELNELGTAIEAMRQVRVAAPDHIPSLLTLSELCIAQRAWPEAVEALEEVVSKGKEPAPRITALFALASVYEKILARPSDAERALRKALSIDEENPRAIRALIHRLAAKQNEPEDGGDHPQARLAAKLEIATLLERLAGVEKDKTAKCEILLELADIRVGVKDAAAAEAAMVEAVATCPEHPRAFSKLARLFRTAGGAVDPVQYARALAAVIGRGSKLGTQDPRWYATLGHIEVDQLARLRDGVTHLKLAVAMAPSLHECRYELATAYSRLGAHDDATKTIFGMLTPNAQALVSLSDPAAALELLERSLNAERRQEEAIVVSELRAIAGELDEGRHTWLRSRRLAEFEAHHAVLDRATLMSHVVPQEGRNILLDVAAAISGVESKLLRADISEVGITGRDRVSKRSGHPTRVLLDRLAKAMGLTDLELVITPNVSRTRVLAQDTPWVVVPKALTELPEPTQLASLGRALARIALSVPWLEELPPPHIEAMLVAAGRTVLPTFARDDVDVLSLKLVLQYEPGLAKDLSRKHKQALEKLVPLMGGPQGRVCPVDVLIGALAKAELRVAYLLTGDVLATIDELRGLDTAFLQATEAPGRGSLAAVLDHPFAGDLVRFALTTEATALRRRVGATWAG